MQVKYDIPDTPAVIMREHKGPVLTCKFNGYFFNF